MFLTTSLLAIVTAIVPLGGTELDPALAIVFVCFGCGPFLAAWLRLFALFKSFPDAFSKRRKIITPIVYLGFFVLALTLSIGTTGNFAVGNLAVILLETVFWLSEYFGFARSAAKNPLIEAVFVKKEPGKIAFLLSLLAGLLPDGDVRLRLGGDGLSAETAGGEALDLPPKFLNGLAGLSPEGREELVSFYNSSIRGRGLENGAEWAAAYLGPADIHFRFSFGYLANYLFFFAFLVSAGFSAFFFAKGTYVLPFALLDGLFLYAFIDGRFFVRYEKGSYAPEAFPAWFRYIFELIGYLLSLGLAFAGFSYGGVAMAIAIWAVSVLPLAIGLTGFFLLRRTAGKALAALPA